MKQREFSYLFLDEWREKEIKQLGVRKKAMETDAKQVGVIDKTDNSLKKPNINIEVFKNNFDVL
jgi:hypothetical protein